MNKKNIEESFKYLAWLRVQYVFAIRNSDDSDYRRIAITLCNRITEIAKQLLAEGADPHRVRDCTIARCGNEAYKIWKYDPELKSRFENLN